MDSAQHRDYIENIFGGAGEPRGGGHYLPIKSLAGASIVLKHTQVGALNIHFTVFSTISGL